MTRRSLRSVQRIRIFDAAGGVCHLCDVKIHAERGEEWDVSHVIPLEAGGADESHNMRPAHRSCHQAHTAAVDAPLIAKVRRQRAKYLGAKTRKSRPIPGSRASGWKARIGGGWERRDTGGST